MQQSASVFISVAATVYYKLCTWSYNLHSHKKSCKDTKIITKSLFDFGIMVKRYHNKIKEGHTHSACSVIHNITQLISGVLPFTLVCNISFRHTHPLCRCFFHSNTHRTTICITLNKHSPNNTIICKTHTHTHPLTKCTVAHAFKHRCAHSVLLSIWGCCCWVVIQRGRGDRDCVGSGGGQRACVSEIWILKGTNELSTSFWRGLITISMFHILGGCDLHVPPRRLCTVLQKRLAKRPIINCKLKKVLNKISRALI